MDPHRLENALLNLCIDARDAMPDVGWLTVEVRHRVLEVVVEPGMPVMTKPFAMEALASRMRMLIEGG